MAPPTGPTNPLLQTLIHELYKTSQHHKVKIWKRIANDLSRPTRIRREVNLERIERFTNDNDTIIIPGKVLGTGDLTKKVNVAAWNFSASARAKINAVGKALSIQELIQENPKGKGVKIIG